MRREKHSILHLLLPRMEEKVDERMTRKTAMKMLIVIMDAIIGKAVGIAKRKIYRVAPRMTRTIIITVAGSIRGEIVNVDIKNATEKRMSAHQNRTSVTLRAAPRDRSRRRHDDHRHKRDSKKSKNSDNECGVKDDEGDQEQEEGRQTKEPTTSNEQQ